MRCQHPQVCLKIKEEEMKSYVFHHNDDDGRCAAFLVKQYLINPMEQLTPENFIEYNYQGNLDKRYPDFQEGDTVYIVDLSLDPATLDLIRTCVDNRVNVLHIDHHHTGIETYNTYKSELDSYKYYRCFMKEGISGTMLTWIYANVLNYEDQLEPMNAKFDFDDDALRNTCCRINDAGQPISKYDKLIVSDKSIERIPDVVRMIDDNDIWKHEIPDTKFFTAGFQLIKDKHPLNHIWVELLDEGDVHQKNDVLSTMLTNGVTVVNYRNSIDSRNLNNGFFGIVNGTQVAFLNCMEGNSSIFQEIYDHCDAVCKFSFDGVKYTYTFYSKENGGADVSELIKWLEKRFETSCGFISGGGHVHAAGCQFKRNIIDQLEIDKAGYIQKRKNIKIDILVAAEQKAIAERERQLREEQEKVAALRAKYKAQMEDEEDYGF